MASNFREIHHLEVKDPTLFNPGGTNALDVFVHDAGGVVSGLLVTGGEGTSLLSGATVGCCVPLKHCASDPALGSSTTTSSREIPRPGRRRSSDRLTSSQECRRGIAILLRTIFLRTAIERQRIR